MTGEVPKRQFKGIWIPAALWLATDLTPTEKCLVAEIDSLSQKDKPCTASNEYLARMFKVTPGRMAHLISQLRSKGWIETVSFDGRTRGLTVKVADNAALSEIDNSLVGNQQCSMSETDKAEAASICTAEKSIEVRKVGKGARLAASSMTENPTPSLQWALNVVADMRKNGADYTSEEAKDAFLALDASGWMWGKNPVGNPISALERQIKTDRLRLGNKSKQKSNPFI